MLSMDDLESAEGGQKFSDLEHIYTIAHYLWLVINLIGFFWNTRNNMFSSKPFLLSNIFFVIAFMQAFVSVTQSERILFILPISSRSMANVFEPLAKGLADRGHNLTIVGPVDFKIKERNVTQIIPITAEDYSRDYPDPLQLRKQNKMFTFPVFSMKNNCRRVFQTKDFRDLENETFHLIIANIFFQDCFAGMMHKIGSPIIFVSPLPSPSGLTELLGNSLPSSFISFFALGDISPNLSFIQRVKSFLYNIYFTVVLDVFTRPHMEEVYREYLGEDLPSIKEIYRRQTSMIFMNSHFALTNPRPLLPSIVEIGGIHCRPSESLPKDLEEFVSDAKDGFIVFSTGSIITPSLMPESVRKAFIQTFAKLKQKVIWKWDKDEGMTDLPPNVKLVKWLPQQDLLGHPNIRLFITHGGLLSTEEAVFHGVPIIGLPVFVDQDANMKQAEILGLGLKAEILDITEEKLMKLIRKVLDDPSYSQRAKELSKIFRDAPQPVLEKAIWNVEYTLRYKGAFHMRSSAINLNIIQYHCIDVVIFLLACLSSVLFFFCYMFILLPIRIVKYALKVFDYHDKFGVKRKRA